MTGAIARALGVREEPAPAAARRRWWPGLRGAALLLLLDNCEHLVDACAALVDALLRACPALRILATSREPLRIAGELVWRVPPLDLPEGGRSRRGVRTILLERATAAGTRLGQESLPDVVRLCRALDGLLLALELAAARTSLLSPAQIADRIDDRFSLLTTGERTAPARQRTLLAAVQWSHDLLSAKEQVLLRRLSVFAGPFDLGLAEQVCAVPPIAEPEIVDLLGGLVDKSLVLDDERRGHYPLLETIRRYAAERLVEAAEREAVRERHLSVLCELQERHFAVEVAEAGLPWPHRLAALIRSRSLLDDLRAALDWAVESGNVPLGLRLCFNSTSLLPVSGNPMEIVGCLERLLSRDLTRVSEEQLAQASGCLAYGLEAGTS